MSQQSPMKTAILTANIGGIDEVYPPAKQKEEYDFLYFTENNLPFPLPHLDSRLKGKYIKTQPHTFLDHDLFIWTDSCVEILDGTFITWVKENLEDHEFVSSLHPDRDNVYDELDYIMGQLKRGNKYLLERYAGQPFQQERSFYISEGMPVNYPLYNGWFYACYNTRKMEDVFNQWWQLIMQYSNFDQSQLAYVLWKNDVKVNAVKTESYLYRHFHKGYEPEKRNIVQKVMARL